MPIVIDSPANNSEVHATFPTSGTATSDVSDITAVLHNAEQTYSWSPDPPDVVPGSPWQFQFSDIPDTPATEGPYLLVISGLTDQGPVEQSVLIRVVN